MRVTRIVCDTRRGNRIEGAARGKEGETARGKAGGGGEEAHNGFVERAAGDEEIIHLETEQEGGEK